MSMFNFIFSVTSIHYIMIICHTIYFLIQVCMFEINCKETLHDKNALTPSPPRPPGTYCGKSKSGFVLQGIIETGDFAELLRD